MRISDWSSDVCSSDLQVVVGVVAAAVLARKGGRAYQQLAVVDLDELLLQQSLVDRAQVLHGQIAVVDEAAAGEVGTARETVDQRGEFDVAQSDARQQVVRSEDRQGGKVRGSKCGTGCGPHH